MDCHGRCDGLAMTRYKLGPAMTRVIEDGFAMTNVK